MKRRRSWFPFIPILAATSCVEPPDAELGEQTQEIASNEGKFEIAIDAPWRLEPRTWTGGTPPAPQPGQECFVQPCTPTYPELPIQITILDADQYEDDLLGSNTAWWLAGTLGDFVSIQVTERIGYNVRVGQPFTIDQLHEIEYQADRWPADGTPYAPDHQVCRKWQGGACAPAFAKIGDKNEWHATLMYRPSLQTRGADLELDVTMRIKRLDPITHQHNNQYFTVVNHLRVHLANAPLPRFDANWAYGDLHYHSQGTDNDGESGYAYRGVLQAMAAMGLDFVLAAEHASDSAQLTDMDLLNPETWPPVSRNFSALRDMNVARFSHLHQWLTSAGSGANREVLSFPWQHWGLERIPQIVLGGEVDAIPELDADERNEGIIRYGNGKHYPWSDACADLPWYIEWIPEAFGCYPALVGTPPTRYLDEIRVRNLLTEQREPGRYLLKDVQGWTTAYARQHLLSLPRRPAWDNFVTSRTSELGGATRRLGDILRQDYDGTGRGWVFLAHPTSAASGDGEGRLGPDIVPYSDVQLETAFQSQHVLGLQVWNEDDRGHTPVATGAASDVDWADVQVSGRFELDPRWEYRWSWMHRVSPGFQLHNGAAAWDKMLLWGLDPARTRNLSWLASGQPRRVFMAGGSDSHGDLNYRRYGEMFGTSSVGDSAIGKPRNLVFLGAPAGPDAATDGTLARSWSHEQIASGLASGQFSITDGPALRIAIDTNRNGVIDATDTPMGGVTQLTRGARVPIVVEWVSTAEFGKVTGVELYLGVHSDVIGKGMVYAPFEHGVRGPNVLDGDDDDGDGRDEDASDDATGAWKATLTAPGGRMFYRLNDHYWGDATGTLRRTNPYHELGVISRLSFDLDPAQFPVLAFDCNGQIARTELADRLFVRAFVKTDGNPPVGRGCDQLYPECVNRWAFSNPVWVTTPPPALTANPGVYTYPLPPPPPFEAASSPSSVRIDRRAGRTFDRGYNSYCASGVPPATANAWYRPWYAIEARRTGYGWPNAVSASGNGALVDGGGAAHYSHGASIYFNPHVWPDPNGSWGCAYSIWYGIRDGWWQSGSENGPLGYPITDERAWNGGAYQYFDKGAMFWKPNLGTVMVRGEIAARHLELLRSGAWTAYPVSSWVMATQPAAGHVANFENGKAIYWSPVTGAYVVEGEFLTRYQNQGGPFSTLGYPLADAEIGVGGVRYQRFTGGTMYAMPLSGFCQKNGAFSWFENLPDTPGQPRR